MNKEVVELVSEALELHNKSLKDLTDHVTLLSETLVKVMDRQTQHLAEIELLKTSVVYKEIEEQ